jgi:DNA-binding IclR family transcriptional regulator
LESYLSLVTLKKFTPNTLTTRALLTRNLDEIKASGYGLDLAEGLAGIHCVSAVILDDYHYPVGAITVIAPSFRLEVDRFEEIGAACIRSAGAIREKLLS